MIWKYLNKADAQWLTDWTNELLDQEMLVVDGQIFWPWTTRSEAEWIMRGDQPSPPVKRGRTRDEKVWQAACDVKLIRQIWKGHKEFLEGKIRPLRYRTGSFEVTAEQIAADRNHADIDLIRNRLHKKA